jgi:thiol-disulfide isomerase/thioredoxin
MLLPTLTQQVNARKRGGGVLGIEGRSAGSSSKPEAQWHQRQGAVKKVTSLDELQSLLAAAEKSCAVVFFTSATCAPCRAVYPLYDELAAELVDKAILIKVDISQAVDIGQQYSVSATPTFITFLHGKQEDKWMGADPAKLRGNVQLLVQMAWPPHPHQSLNLPTFSNSNAKPVIFSRTPPIPKLLAKMGSVGDNPAVQGVANFVKRRNSQGPADASLPDMTSFASFLREATTTLPPDIMFTVVDLLRCSLVDPRFSGFFAEEKEDSTMVALFEYVNNLENCPYALRLVSLQMACNLFASPLFPEQILGHERLRSAVTQLISSSFLDDGNSNVRVAAASLLFNMALENSTKRRDGPGDVLPEEDQIELAAAVLEAISQEEVSSEGLEGMLLALGYLVYMLPVDGTLADLLRTMDAQDTVLAKKKHFPGLTLADEVGKELLGKGLKRP